jgi:hypothetical protein
VIHGVLFVPQLADRSAIRLAHTGKSNKTICLFCGLRVELGISLWQCNGVYPSQSLSLIPSPPANNCSICFSALAPSGFIEGFEPLRGDVGIIRVMKSDENKTNDYVSHDACWLDQQRTAAHDRIFERRKQYP